MEYKNKKLVIENVSVEKIAQKFSTPTYCYSYKRLKVGLKTSVSFKPFCFCKLLIMCRVNVVFPTPISPIRKMQSFLTSLSATF